MTDNNYQQFKPWRSLEEQLDRLIANGLTVTDRKKALHYLERLGYYRLSGYWYSQRAVDIESSCKLKKVVRTSKFITNSSFEGAVKLYVFDKKLRLLAMDALERIEMAIRVDIAYLLGQHDPLAHKMPKYLHGHFAKQIKKKGYAKGKTEHQLWVSKYEDSLFKAKRTPFIAHNCSKYGEPPIWVAIEVWDFGLMSKLFAGMRQADKDKISLKYGAASGDELASWLRSFNFIRNVSAHHSRLWNINILERSPLPESEEWLGLENERPFFYFCLMQKMLSVLCPNSTWGSRLLELLATFPSNEGFNIADFGFKEKGWVRFFKI